MKELFFITGTDTGVGKTYVACQLLRAAQQHIAALPPLQTPDKAAVFGEKGQVDIVFTAKTH